MLSSLKVTLILVLTSVASVRSGTETIFAQEGGIVELRCPLTNDWSDACFWRFSGTTFA